MNTAETNSPALSSALLIRVAIRSFLLQASWNYRGMMSMGFLYAISPGLDAIFSDNTERETAYMRHFEYFNTNPYFSPIVMGVVLSLEERFNRGEITSNMIHEVKEGLMTSCAAVGDGFFWDSWRPFAAILSLVFASGNYVLTPFIFLLLYNLPHIYFRFAGIFWGYREGTRVIKKLKEFQFPLLRQNLRYGTLALLAYLIPNHVSMHTPFFINNNLPIEYFFIGEKLVQGVGAAVLVALGVICRRAGMDVLLISFLLMISALVLYHWEILI